MNPKIQKPMNNLLLTILGPTASGKTHLAVCLADVLNAEIISGDSRQVYRGMNVGTGKDLSEYTIDGKHILYHLIDIVEAGYKYNVYEYQRDFAQAYASIQKKEKQAILCGGTGLYLESVLRGYKLVPVPVNPDLRSSLDGKSLHELTTLLSGYKKLHNTTDVNTVKRAIRAIEIEDYYCSYPAIQPKFQKVPNLVFGLSIDRENRRKYISKRLKERLEEGMIVEIKLLMDNGLSAEDLIYYGLEYKYVTLYITGKLSYQEMFGQLEIAIHQFAKRQMTWFRGMEKRGIKIHWLDALSGTDKNTQEILEVLNQVC